MKMARARSLIMVLNNTLRPSGWWENLDVKDICKDNCLNDINTRGLVTTMYVNTRESNQTPNGRMRLGYTARSGKKIGLCRTVHASRVFISTPRPKDLLVKAAQVNCQNLPHAWGCQRNPVNIAKSWHGLGWCGSLWFFNIPV